MVFVRPLKSETKMFYKFFVSGFSPEQCQLTNGWEVMPVGQMKQQARRVSHNVPGADDQIGPAVRFERYGRIFNRALTRREMVFGVKKPDQSEGGFAGLVSWCDQTTLCEVRVDLGRAGYFSARSWIVQFVREIILAAGWTIEREEEANSSLGGRL